MPQAVEPDLDPLHGEYGFEQSPRHTDSASHRVALIAEKQKRRWGIPASLYPWQLRLSEDAVLARLLGHPNSCAWQSKGGLVCAEPQATVG